MCDHYEDRSPVRLVLHLDCVLRIHCINVYWIFGDEMSEIDLKTIKELVELKRNSPDEYTKYITDWKSIQKDLAEKDEEKDKPIKGRHSVDRENYKKEYLEDVIKEWQNRGIIA